MPRAVVFAYHNVGVRCLKVLLANRVDVALVVTHADNPREEIWFDSVERTAREYGIPAITPDDPNSPMLVERVAGLAPDFIFSFYYRLMLGAPLLKLPRRGALNVHGSLLPKYRGRVPVNWAIIHGETQTGATLHYMTEKPDNGDIVAQFTVPILPDDDAKEVFDKVTVAAELALHVAMPALLDGTASRVPQDERQATYFGARTPDDGVIDWSKTALEIHNLVRAVAPPYPGARTRAAGRPARILRTHVVDAAAQPSAPTLLVDGERIIARCGGGGALHVHRLEVDGALISASALAHLLQTSAGPALG